MTKQTPYQIYLATLRDKDRPSSIPKPTGVIAAKHANFAGNYMAIAKSNWSNPQNAPPSCWEGLIDDKP